MGTLVLLLGFRVQHIHSDIAFKLSHNRDIYLNSYDVELKGVVTARSYDRCTQEFWSQTASSFSDGYSRKTCMHCSSMFECIQFQRSFLW